MLDFVDVGSAFDSNYAPYAAALIRSLSFYSSRPIRFHVIVPESDRQHPNILSLEGEFAHTWNLDLHIYSSNQLSEMANEGLISDVGYINVYTYSKLLFSSLLPREVDKFLYLDPDTFIRRDPEPLFAFEYGGIFAACLEIKPWAEQLFGIPDKLYFNAGVFITSLEYWRNNKVFDKCLETLKIRGQTHFMDQDVLNCVFDNKFSVLPKTFNTFGDEFFALSTLENLTNPLVVHFAGGNKPWSQSRRVSPWVHEWDRFNTSKDSVPRIWNPYFLFKYKFFVLVWKFLPIGIKKLIKVASGRQ
jgi:lipopolysaccharide biosynthesis glycosyltransferase